MCLDDLFLDKFAPRELDDDPRDQSGQIEPTIESIAAEAEVMLGVLAVLPSVACADQDLLGLRDAPSL